MEPQSILFLRSIPRFPTHFISDAHELQITLAPLNYQNPLTDEYLPIIQDNQVRIAIHQLCTIPMGENLIASDHTNETSIYVQSSTAHEQSIANQCQILANTSTLAGGYAIINTSDSTLLPSLTFDDSPTHHAPIVSNTQVHNLHLVPKSTASSTPSTNSSHKNLSPTSEYDPISSAPIITNIDFIHSMHNSSTSTTQEHQSTPTSHSSQSSTHSSIHLDWTTTGFTIHRLKESPQQRIDRINSEVKHSVVKGRFVRSSLINGLSKSQWIQAERDILTTHFETNKICGDPISPPHDSSPMRPVSTHTIKAYGTHRARQNGDETNNHQRQGNQDVDYARCLDQSSFRLPQAIAVVHNLLQLAGDVKNAFAHACPLSNSAYIIPDQAIKDYYEWKHQRPLPDGYVFPLIGILQGHHEASPAWEEFITVKLTTLFGFKATAHEPALSQTFIKEVKVYLAHQVDNFRFVSNDMDIIKHIIATLQSNGVCTRIVDQGTFNGANITECSDTIKVHATSYINKLDSKIGKHLSNIKLPKQVCTNS